MAKAEKKFVEIAKETFGEEIFTSSNEVQEIVPTSSLALDVSTGRGGIPRGRFTHIYGPDSSGKTTLAIELSKNNLAFGGKTFYVDIEQTLDSGLVNTILGEYKKEDNFVHVMPETGEDAFRICESAINSGEFSLIIFDSVGALAPEKEMEDDFGDSHYALVARAISTFLRRNAYKVRVNKIAFVFLNQVRANIGAFIKSFEVPGGYALKHYSSLTISLFRGKTILLKTDDKGSAIGNLVNFTIMKNKIGIPHRSATFPIIWGRGIDRTRDIVDFAENLGVISKRGPYKVFNGEPLGLGVAKTIAKLEQDSGVLDLIVKSCYNAVQVAPVGETEEVDNGEVD